ncbi:MAG: hypothetical protein AABY27_07380 [Pseudomonadota bacterium]
MKNRFFSFKLVVGIFIILSTIGLVFLSQKKAPKVQEVYKELKLTQNDKL